MPTCFFVLISVQAVRIDLRSSCLQGGEHFPKGDISPASLSLFHVFLLLNPRYLQLTQWALRVLCCTGPGFHCLALKKVCTPIFPQEVAKLVPIALVLWRFGLRF